MLCAKCLSQINAGRERCEACGEDPLLVGRYRLDRPLDGTRGPGTSRSYRVTQVEDGMLFRASAIDLSERNTADLSRARATAKQLLEVDNADLATLVEQIYDEQRRTLWMIYEHVSGTDIGSLIAESDPRLSRPRWLATLLSSLSALLLDLHRRGLRGVDFEPTQIGLRGRNSARAKAGPPRLALLELRIPPLYGLPEDTRDDVHELGLLFVRMLAAGGESTRAAAEALVERGAWRQLDGLDGGLQLLLEQMLATDPKLRIDSAKLREETARLSASLRETRREPTPLRIIRNAPSMVPSSGQRMNKLPATALPLSRESVRAYRPAEDSPVVMRPDELSRQLSQAQHKVAALNNAPPSAKPGNITKVMDEPPPAPTQQRSMLLLVVVVAVVVALTTTVVLLIAT